MEEGGVERMDGKKGWTIDRKITQIGFHLFLVILCSFLVPLFIDSRANRTDRKPRDMGREITMEGAKNKKRKRKREKEKTNRRMR